MPRARFQQSDAILEGKTYFLNIYYIILQRESNVLFIMNFHECAIHDSKPGKWCSRLFIVFPFINHYNAVARNYCNDIVALLISLSRYHDIAIILHRTGSAVSVLRVSFSRSSLEETGSRVTRDVSAWFHLSFSKIDTTVEGPSRNDERRHCDVPRREGGWREPLFLRSRMITI